MATSDIEKWFVHYSPKEVEQVNIYPNVSIFNRKIYTFGDEKEVYIKFKTINADIETYDEVAMLDTNSCIYKISENRYVVALKSIGEQKVTILGELGQRYIDKNHLNDLNIDVKDVTEFGIVPISYIYDKSTLTFDLMLDDAKTRLEDNFTQFFEQVKYGKS